MNYPREGMITNAITDAVVQDSGRHRKAKLLNQIAAVRAEITELGNLLKTSTPQAANLIVTKDIEKLLRSAEKVQMELQLLIL